MKPGLYALYAQLADGRLHNGAELAGEMDITRAAVWKRMQSLREMGLAITGTAGDGYRLEHAVELLDADEIRSRLSSGDVEVETAGAVDSTNARLVEAGSPHARAVVAEAQTAGRGRRGRGWQSPPGSGLYLSLAWRFESGLAGLAPLSLVVGLTAAETLGKQAGAAVAVKWPNDLFVDDAKLGGCLVEINGAAEGPCRAVVGVGINLFRTEAMGPIDQAWTTLEDHARPQGRNALAAAVLDAMTQSLTAFDRAGLEAFMARWDAVDALRGRRVTILQHGQAPTDAIATGIDEQGRLRLSENGHTRVLASGEVSIRVA